MRARARRSRARRSSREPSRALPGLCARQLGAQHAEAPGAEPRGELLRETVGGEASTAASCAGAGRASFPCRPAVASMARADRARVRARSARRRRRRRSAARGRRGSDSAAPIVRTPAAASVSSVANEVERHEGRPRSWREARRASTGSCHRAQAHERGEGVARPRCSAWSSRGGCGRSRRRRDRAEALAPPISASTARAARARGGRERCANVAIASASEPGLASRSRSTARERAPARPRPAGQYHAGVARRAFAATMRGAIRRSRRRMAATLPRRSTRA
jgi:hypothetical protein